MSPKGLKTYRTIGPFDTHSLPKGLLREHHLKKGSWGKLTVKSGRILLVWDDGSDRKDLLTEGDMAMIAPQRPHHLELVGDFLLQIEFQH